MPSLPSSSVMVVLPCRTRFEQARQGGGQAGAEIHGPVQLEPVDAGSNFGPHRLCGPEGAPFGLDAPAFSGERADRGRQLRRRDAQRVARVAEVPSPREPELA